MYSDADIVSVHSIAEAYLFLMIVRCRACGKGPLKQRGDITKTAEGWSLATTCSTCGDESSLRFAIEPAPTREQARSDRINPTAERSAAIDLLGWLSLFQTIIAESHKSSDKPTMRQLAYEAAQCLDEALKFYDGDNELPTESAFFTEESRRRFRDHPQYFNRAKWRERRLKLPDIATHTQPLHEPRRRWWQFWR
jgi:hypothetical protein